AGVWVRFNTHTDLPSALHATGTSTGMGPFIGSGVPPPRGYFQRVPLESPPTMFVESGETTGVKLRVPSGVTAFGSPPVTRWTNTLRGLPASFPTNTTGRPPRAPSPAGGDRAP